MIEIILLLVYVLPFLAVLALCAWTADVLLPRFPRAVRWIERFLEGR